ncbi:MAG: hypothetical protein M4579_005234 [Chaenotheca gracillima]|nr:MAG: hypothetical protein M4579_005234 [Chaenotheca gracillima]
MTSPTKTIHVPHLSGIDASYRLSANYAPTKPTLILVNSFTTNVDLYRSSFANDALTDTVNLLAIELLGHGKTRTKTEHWTYWDTAIMNLQVMDALGIERAFVLGTSQGGWITVRMALLAPEKIAGIIPLGTSMDYESPRTVNLGCWDAKALLTGNIEEWTSRTPTPAFEPADAFCGALLDQGVGKDFPKEDREFWTNAIKTNYRGDEGRRRIRMATINLRDRDGLHLRLCDVVCPVLWLHGTSDITYSVENAREEILMFTGSPSARLQVVEGGQHFLSLSHPKEVDQAVIDFVRQWEKS